MARLLAADGGPLAYGTVLLAQRGVTLSSVDLPPADILEPRVAAAVADPGNADALAALTAAVDVPEAVLAKADPALRPARGVLVLDPEVTDPELTATLAAWHVNDAHELHLVLSGDGSFWFADGTGVVVQVVLEPGDVIAIAGTEHRFEARTAQAFLIRHTAPGDMTPTATGR